MTEEKERAGMSTEKITGSKVENDTKVTMKRQLECNQLHVTSLREHLATFRTVFKLSVSRQIMVSG